MFHFSRLGRRLMAALFIVSIPAVAAAQETLAVAPPPSLKLPTYAASIASAADWASTYHAMSNYHVRETNVLLQPFQKSPGTLVVVGAAIDAASFTAWNKVMGPRHPRLAVGGMWAMAGFRAYLVLHNLRNEQKALKR